MASSAAISGFSGSAGAGEAAVPSLYTNAGTLTEGAYPLSTYGGTGQATGMGASGGSTFGSVAGGIAGGVAKAVPYYGAAKLGGEILTGMTEGKGGSVPQYFNEMGQTLKKPLQVEQYAVQEKLGIDSPAVNAVLDVLNPAGFVVNKLEEAAGTVICTELYRQGFMDEETYLKDAEFGKKQDIEVIAGYHTWGIPLARAMRNSRVVTWLVKPLALAWAEDMSGKKNALGAFLNKIGIPICRFIGERVMEVAHG